MSEYNIIIKKYSSKEFADIDSLKMKENGYHWYSGWYEVDGYCVDYRKKDKK